MGDLKTPNGHFAINWPLVFLIGPFFIRTDWVYRNSLSCTFSAVHNHSQYCSYWSLSNLSPHNEKKRSVSSLFKLSTYKAWWYCKLCINSIPERNEENRIKCYCYIMFEIMNQCSLVAESMCLHPESAPTKQLYIGRISILLRLQCSCRAKGLLENPLKIP